MTPKRTFLERFTSRPFLAAVIGFLSSFGAAMTVLSPTVPADKVNAIVGLAIAGIGALSVFIHGELKSDRETAVAATKAAADATPAVDKIGQVLDTVQQVRQIVQPPSGISDEVRQLVGDKVLSFAVERDVPASTLPTVLDDNDGTGPQDDEAVTP